MRLPRMEISMTKFVLTYHGGAHEMPTSDVEKDQMMEAWGAWFAELGDHLVDGGSPFGPRVALAADGSVTDGGIVQDLNGFGVIEAESMDAAIALSKGCPVLAGGSTVQISQAVEI